MTLLAFCDTETTGLDPDRHEVWEVGLILRTDRPEGGTSVESEHVWQLPVNLGRADAVALTVGRFYDRVEEWGDRSETLTAFAREFATLTHGAHLVAAVPSFDDAFLRRLLRVNGACPGWHYHLVDVEALAAGSMATSVRSSPTAAANVDPSLHLPPWKSSELSLAVGVDPEQYDRHTALGDARWAKAIYDAVMRP